METWKSGTLVIASQGHLCSRRNWEPARWQLGWVTVEPVTWGSCRIQQPPSPQAPTPRTLCDSDVFLQWGEANNRKEAVSDVLSASCSQAPVSPVPPFSISSSHGLHTVGSTGLKPEAACSANRGTEVWPIGQKENLGPSGKVCDNRLVTMSTTSSLLLSKNQSARTDQR